MENVENIIKTICAVVSTMDTITIVGIDNQDKFVGCANALQSVIKQLREQMTEAAAEKQEVTDG